MNAPAGYGTQLQMTATRDGSARHTLQPPTGRPAVRVTAPYDNVFAEAPVVRALRPWSEIERPTVSSAQPATLAGEFSRMIALDPTLLDVLPAWWRAHAREGRVEIARRLFIEQPQRGHADTWRMRGSLRSPWRARSIPVQLSLWPRLDAWTRLSLEPQRGVHVGRRYFRSGQRVLDTFCARLIHELVPHSVTGATRERPQPES